MDIALGLAARGLGRTAPNPAVGCVLVGPDGRIVGRGWTQPGGRPHAEDMALAEAGAAARGATAYVTLEPCSHHGRTPPCADAMIAAGIGRAVVALIDPDPRVDGSGIARMRAAGIPVDLGLRAAEAAALNEGFIRRVRDGRPLVTLKLATSLDGRIATRAGESQWITGPAARAWGHALRARHDAVMVGSGTALADDPLLTCRLPGLEDRSPTRVIMDSRLSLPLTARLVATARDVPTWLVARPDAEAVRREAFARAGVTVLEAPPDAAGLPDLATALGLLAELGITRLLIEGGARLAAMAVRCGLVDRLDWLRSPAILGGDGLPAVAGFGLDALDAAPRLVRHAVRTLGEDLVETYVRAS